MKKLGIALIAALCLNGAARAGMVGTLVTASGTFEVKSGCAVTLKIQNPTTSANLGALRDMYTVTTFTVTPTCDSKLWYGGHDRDSKGYGVLATAAGAKASYTFTATSNDRVWVKDGGRDVVKSTGIVKANTSVTSNVALAKAGEFGLPKAAGVYKYSIDAGLWND